MNHNIACITKDQPALVALAAVTAVLVTTTAIVGTGHTAFADNGNKTKGFNNDGISLTTNTKQNQACQTAGGVSPITALEKVGSCIPVSTNTGIQTEGGIGEVKK